MPSYRTVLDLYAGSRAISARSRGLIRFKTSPEIIQRGVLTNVRFPLSLRNVEDLQHERGIEVCQESVRLRVDRFGSCFANKIRKRRSAATRPVTQWRARLDEACVMKRRDKGAALKIIKESNERDGNPNVVVTDKSRPCEAAVNAIGNQNRQETRWHLNTGAVDQNKVQGCIAPARLEGSGENFVAVGAGYLIGDSSVRTRLAVR